MKRKKTTIEECLDHFGVQHKGGTVERARRQLRALLKAAKLLEWWATDVDSFYVPVGIERQLALLRREGVLPEEKPMCSQCGRPVCGRACGPTHAAMRAKEMQRV